MGMGQFLTLKVDLHRPKWRFFRQNMAEKPVYNAGAI